MRQEQLLHHVSRVLFADPVQHLHDPVGRVEELGAEAALGGLHVAAAGALLARQLVRAVSCQTSPGRGSRAHSTQRTILSLSMRLVGGRVRPESLLKAGYTVRKLTELLACDHERALRRTLADQGP